MQTLEAHTEGKTIAGGYRVERFSVDKLNDLVYLHMAVYDKLLNRDFLLKKYNTAFTVVTYVGYLAYDQTDLPVAFYGVLPCFVDHGGRLTLAGQSADTMTHPEHRNKGLFVALANQTYSLCRAEGIRLIFGFPNQNSLPGFINKLGWEAVGCLERFTIPVKAIPLEKFATKFNVAKPLYDAYLNLVIKAEKQPSGISNSVLGEGYGGVYRDEEFLTYKGYAYTHTVQIGQARVWFKIKNGLIVGDITGLGDNMDEVVAKLLKLTKRLGLQQLQFQVCAKSRLHAMLQKYAQPIPSFTIAIKDMGSGIPADKLAFTFADIDIF